jgi:hypothetical protein
VVKARSRPNARKASKDKERMANRSPILSPARLEFLMDDGWKKNKNNISE